MKSAVSILLSVCVLFGSLGITIATHYCYDKAVKTSVLLSLNTFGCGMMETSTACSATGEGSPALTQGSCCDNKFQVADFDDDFKPQTVIPEIDLNFLNAFVATSIHFSSGPKVVSPRYNFHPPPLLETDRQVLFQSFLI